MPVELDLPPPIKLRHPWSNILLLQPPPIKLQSVDAVFKVPPTIEEYDPDAMFKTLKMELKNNIKELSELSTKKLVNARIRKFSDMGSFTETA